MPTTQNMAKAGYAAAVGIAKEVTAGTAVAPATYLPITQATANVVNKLIKRDPIRQSKAMQQPGLGILDVNGQLDLRVDPVSIGPLLAYSCGTETVTGASATGYTHTFKMGAQSTATVSIDYGTGSIYQHTGSKFNSLELSCKAGEDLMAKLQWQGMNIVPTAGTLSPTFTVETPFEWGFITTATIGGATFDATDFAITLKNNNKPMYTATSGRIARAINELGSDVSGKFTYPLKDDTINQALWGATTGPATGALATFKTIIITFTHPDSIPGAGVNKFALTMTVNNCVLEAAPTPLAMKSEEMQSVTFSAAESTPGAADALSIALINSTSTAY